MAQDQAQLLCSTIPAINRVKLDIKIDSEHGGVQRHLGEIASAMDEWEGSVADALGLTKVDVANIRRKHRDSLSLQTRAALQRWKEKHGFNATYRNLLMAFLKAGKTSYAEAVCKVLGGDPSQIRATPSRMHSSMPPSTGIAATQGTRLRTSTHYHNLYIFLAPYADQWRDIGRALGFFPNELSMMQANMMLMTQGSCGYLSEMLTKWLQWAPGDGRGSKNFATYEDLRAALLKVSGTASIAYDLGPALGIQEGGVQPQPQQTSSTAANVHSVPRKSHDLGMRDNFAITRFLNDLNNEDIIVLGQALGLSRPKLLRMRHMPGDMIDSWLRREDDVIRISGDPTWSTLATALENVGQGGAALNIRKAHNIPADHSVEVVQGQRDVHVPSQVSQAKYSVSVTKPQNKATKNGHAIHEDSFSQEFNKWLQHIKVGRKDRQILADNGVTSDESFRTLTSQDLKEMKLTLGGRKLLEPHLPQSNGDQQQQEHNLEEELGEQDGPDFMKWLEQHKVGKADRKILADGDVTTDEVFHTLTPQDLKTMKLTLGGRKILEKQLSQTQQRRVAADHSSLSSGTDKEEGDETTAGQDTTESHVDEFVHIVTPSEPIQTQNGKLDHQSLGGTSDETVDSQNKKDSLDVDTHSPTQNHPTPNPSGNSGTSDETVDSDTKKDSLDVDTHSHTQNHPTPNPSGNSDTKDTNSQTLQSLDDVERDNAQTAKKESSQDLPDPTLQNKTNSDDTKPVSDSDIPPAATNGGGDEASSSSIPNAPEIQAKGGSKEKVKSDKPPAETELDEDGDDRSKKKDPASNPDAPVSQANGVTKEKVKSDPASNPNAPGSQANGGTKEKVKSDPASNPNAPGSQANGRRKEKVKSDPASNANAPGSQANGGTKEKVKSDPASNPNAPGSQANGRRKEKVKSGLSDLDWSEIVRYLKKLDENQIRLLGGELGLNVYDLEKMHTLPDEMVTAWLRKEEGVLKKCGDPLKWEHLVEALRKMGQDGIANAILGEKCSHSEPGGLSDHDWSEIVHYLHKLDKNQIVRLGGELGLSVFSLEKMDRLPDDMVRAWLRKEEKVTEKCGDPLKWEHLVKALCKIGQKGIADVILKEKCGQIDPGTSDSESPSDNAGQDSRPGTPPPADDNGEPDSEAAASEPDQPPSPSPQNEPRSDTEQDDDDIPSSSDNSLITRSSKLLYVTAAAAIVAVASVVVLTYKYRSRFRRLR